MTEASMMQQEVRRGFTLTGLVAAAVGTVNTAVAVTNGVAVANPASRPLLTDWVTITQSAANGTTMKFLRKGIYRIDVVMPLVADEVTAVMAGISLDAPAAQFLAAGATFANAVTSWEDFTSSTGIAAMFTSLKLHATVHITAPLRGSALAANGTPGGTARIHLADGAGGAVTAASVSVALVLTKVNELAELFG